MVPCAHAAPPMPKSKTGTAVMGTRVANHTANLAAEFRKRVARSTTPAKIVMSVPSTRQSTMRSVDARAISFRPISSRWNASIIVESLAPFQQLPEPLQFFCVNPFLFHNAHSELLIALAEQAPHPFPHLDS